LPSIAIVVGGETGIPEKCDRTIERAKLSTSFLIFSSLIDTTLAEEMVEAKPELTNQRTIMR